MNNSAISQSLAKKVLTRVVLPAVIVGAGIFGAQSMLGANAQEVSVPVAAPAAPLVRTTILAVGQFAPELELSGVAEAARTLTLVPEVSGRLSHVAESLEEGGRVRAGETLVRIDPRSYRIALAQAQAELKRAEAELLLERGRAESASREWSQFGSGTEGPNALATRKPQLAAAEALIALRRAAVSRAELDLSRTTIKAPFEALVESEQVELGQVVAPGGAIATLVAYGDVRVRAQIELEQVDAFGLGVQGASAGAHLSLKVPVGSGAPEERAAQFLRLASKVDANTRKAEILVRAEPDSAGRSLLPGTFLKVKLQAGETREAFRVQRSWIGGNTNVWVVDSESKLRSVTAKALWRDASAVYVAVAPFRSYLSEGRLRVLTEPLPGGLEGGLVRVLPEPDPSMAPTEQMTGASAPAAVGKDEVAP